MYPADSQGRNEVYGIRDQRPKKGGIRDHSLGSGIKALGIGISVFSMGSRIRRLDFVGSGIKIFITFGIKD